MGQTFEQSKSTDWLTHHGFIQIKGKLIGPVVISLILGDSLTFPHIRSIEKV